MKSKLTKLALALTIGSTGLMASGVASAAGVNISKLRINLTEQKPSDFLTLTNSEAEKSSFETTVYTWKQKDGVIRDGVNIAPETVLEESENIIVSPQTVVLLPKADRTIRLIADDPELALEDGSYRLRLQQLNTKEGFSSGTNVNILFNISLPVFFNKEDEKKAKDMSFENEFGSYDRKNLDENGKVTGTEKTGFLKLKNTDEQHVQLLNIAVGEKTHDLSGYLLPGNVGYYDIPMEFLDAKELTISTDKGSFVINR